MKILLLTRRMGQLCALASLLALGSTARADGTITVSSTPIVDVKGWGVFPANYDRQTPTFASGNTDYGGTSWLPSSGATPSTLHNVVTDLGFTIARVAMTPNLLNNDNTLNSARVQDLEDHLSILRAKGITQTLFCNWTPPARMKLPDRVRYGSYNGSDQYLDPAFADGVGYDYADFMTAVLKRLKNDGFAPPLAISIQNEPSIAKSYDGCVWNRNDSQKLTYRKVVKSLRSKLNANGLSSVKILAPEDAGMGGITQLLGSLESTPSNGFSLMNSDTAYRDAIGGFAYHTYYGAANSKDLNAAMASYSGRTRWMTEISTLACVRGDEQPNSGDFQLNVAINFVRRMAGDLIDLKAQYWFFWRGWHSNSGAGDESLVYGTKNSGSANKTRAYYAFQKIWKTVTPGSYRVVQTTNTDPDLRSDNAGLVSKNSGSQMSAGVDIIAFDSTVSSKTVMVLVNRFGSAKSITRISGLKGGSGANVYRLTSTSNMAQGPSLSISNGATTSALSLPAYSITVVDVGAGGSSASTIKVETYDPPEQKSSDEHLLATDSNASSGTFTVLKANASGDYVTYKVPGVQAQSYDVYVQFKKGADRGKCQMSIAPSLSGQYDNHGSVQDLFNTAYTYNRVKVTTMSFGTAGTKYVKFTGAGKNSSAGDYWLAIDYIELVPTP